MIVFGTEDIGPLKYLIALEKWIGDSNWIVSSNTYSFLNKEKIISGFDPQLTSIIVTGTSINESLDKDLILRSKSVKIPSVSIIEHWSWYKKRFVLNGNLILPDHIIVNDNYAKEQAIKDGLPADKIFVGGNPYLESLSKSKLHDVDVISWKKKNNLVGKKIILFITEALKDSFFPDTEDYLGYDEFEVLNDIIKILPEKAVLLIKTHPEEENDKYIRYQSDCVRIFEQINFEHMVQVPNTIIGMASMLLIELAMFRDDIISYRPNARKGFVGDEIGATHHTETKSELKKYLLDPPSSPFMPFRKKFNGSGKRISEFLDSVIGSSTLGAVNYSSELSAEMLMPTPKNFQIYLEKLFPICRSITGHGTRKTLQILNEITSINIEEISSGTKVYDWVIPDEWNIKNAWIKVANGEKIIDFKNNNLHVMNYSIPINQELNWEELKPRLYTHKKLDNAIPYLTTYYKKDWGFCLTKKQYNELEKQKEGIFQVLIDSKIEPGSLTYGECLIPGKSKKEILISCYICHPSMANDCLSGVLITSFLANYIKQEIDNYWSYRIVFVPETIGAITYCTKNEKSMKNIDIGLVVTTAGGPGKYGYKRSWDKKNYLNKLCEDVFSDNGIDFTTYPFDIHGSDERQYSSPGFRINTVTITKDKYYEYPEYHTSLDNLDFVNGEQIHNSFLLYCQLIDKIESQIFYINKFSNCETMLSKHGLYPHQGASLIPAKNSLDYLDVVLWVLFYSDGKHSVKQLKDELNIDSETIDSICSKLESTNIIERL